jgi:hypothetical protein
VRFSALRCLEVSERANAGQCIVLDDAGVADRSTTQPVEHPLHPSLIHTGTDRSTRSSTLLSAAKWPGHSS